MSDEEIATEGDIRGSLEFEGFDSGVRGFDRILSDRDSLRAALEEIMRRADAFSGAGLSKVAPISIIAHAALQEAE